MLLKIEKQDDAILIKEDSKPKEIEKYKMNEAIDFSQLMQFLLKLELNEKIDYECDASDFNDQEKVLLSLLVEIKDNYNQKVEDFNTFKKTYTNKAQNE